MEGQQIKGRGSHTPVSFLVRCQQADLTEVGGKAYNLGTEGIAIKTNCPIRIGDELAVEFHLPDTLKPLKLAGEVAWRQFHGDSPGQEETLFTAGIKFVELEEPLRTVIYEYTQSSGD